VADFQAHSSIGPCFIVVKRNTEDGAISILMAGGKAAVREVRQVEV
jgi:hypothetical protein